MLHRNTEGDFKLDLVPIISVMFDYDGIKRAISFNDTLVVVS